MDPMRGRAGVVRAPHRNLQCFSYPMGPVSGPCGTHMGAVWQPYGHTKELTQPEIAKLPHGSCMWPHGSRRGSLRSPHRLFISFLRSLVPYGHMMHASKLYGPRTGRKNSYGAAQGPCEPRMWTYDFCSKQPVNSPGAALTGPGGVMWLGH